MTSISAVRAIIIALVISGEADFCNFPSFILLILQITLGHQIVDLIVMVYVQYTTLSFIPQVLPNVSL
jgi:hypothetical protein